VPFSGAGVSWPVVAALATVLGLDVLLVLTGHDASSLLTLLGVLGIGTGLAAHTEVRAKQASDKLDTTSDKLDRITEQTNGVLDQRIQKGSTKAITDVLRRAGFVIPDE
jgi:uncharacterized protein HemX